MFKNQNVEFNKIENTGELDLLVIVGEHSGDQHAAKIVKEIKQKNNNLKICAFGGPALVAENVPLVLDMMPYSVVGIWEAILRYPFFLKLHKKIIHWIQEYQPKNILFVDYPGFNLALAKGLYKEGLSVKGGGNIKLHFYISPQIWAWKAYRRFKMARVLDHLGVIFPFEIDLYKDTNLDVKFVGHPLANDHPSDLGIHYDVNAPILLLPGSRKVAISYIFPKMLQAVELYLNQYPQQQFLVVYPTKLILTVLTKILNQYPHLKSNITLTSSQSNIFGKAALMSSGTMSLKCALSEIPGAIVYIVNISTYLIARSVVKVSYLGMSNILLQRPMYPEYIQFSATKENLYKELVQCVHNPQRILQTQKDSTELKALLKGPQTNQNVVDWLLSNMN